MADAICIRSLVVVALGYTGRRKIHIFVRGTSSALGGVI